MILDLENDAIIAAEKLRPLIPHLPTETLVDLVGAGTSTVFSQLLQQRICHFLYVHPLPKRRIRIFYFSY